jgi:hypothetical protein
VDSFVTKDILHDFAVAKSCLDLSPNHSSILFTLTADVLNQEKEPILSNRNTNWDDFRRLVNERLTLNIPLKTEEDIEAAASLNKCHVSRVAPQQETCLAQTHIHKTEETGNDAHQNALAAWT